MKKLIKERPETMLSKAFNKPARNAIFVSVLLRILSSKRKEKFIGEQQMCGELLSKLLFT